MEQTEMNAQTGNKMGVMPIRKLIVNMSVPMMISMLVQALYNIVDSIFVAKISENALTAVTISVGAGTGVGINALLSRALGAREFDKSDKAANNGIFLAFLSFIVSAILGLTVTGPFIKSQTSSADIIQYGDAYLGIVMTLSFGLFMQVTFERLLQSTGRTMLSMISQLTGAIINIFLDPVMIFGLLGCPKLGVAGAAYATVTWSGRRCIRDSHRSDYCIGSWIYDEPEIKPRDPYQRRSHSSSGHKNHRQNLFCRHTIDPNDEHRLSHDLPDGSDPDRLLDDRDGCFRCVF